MSDPRLSSETITGVVLFGDDYFCWLDDIDSAIGVLEYIAGCVQAYDFVTGVVWHWDCVVQLGLTLDRMNRASN